MTKDYTQGKIYRIVSSTGKQYVGSTVETLSQRLSRHRRYMKDPSHQGVSSVKLLQEDPQAKIILIENYPCQNSEELRAREQYWIEHIEGGCVNFHRAHTPYEVVQEQAKKRAEENKEVLRQQAHQRYIATYEPEYHTRLNNLFKTTEDLEEEERIRKEKKRQSDAEYRAKNLEKVRAKDAEYRQQEHVKEKAKEKAKLWREQNLERQKAWQKEKIKCECGAEVTRSGLSHHRKMKKHIEFMEKKN